MHELDHPFFIGEPDTSMWSGATWHGDSSAEDIKKWLAQRDIKLPSNALYLALGVGQAYQEEAFANHLGISPDRVTMVDRKFREYTKSRLREKFYGAEMVETGIFSYLTNPPKTGFSLVSAFGIEYIFGRRGSSESFVQSIPNLIHKGGIVYISFYVGDNIDKLWEKNGFEVVKGHTGSWNRQMYVYRG